MTDLYKEQFVICEKKILAFVLTDMLGKINLTGYR